MVIAVLRLIVPPEKRSDTEHLLDLMIGPTSAKQGCVSCRLYHGHESRDELLLVEEWKSMEALEQHLTSDEFKKILEAMNMAVKQPYLAFHNVSQTSGIELVEIACRTSM